MSSETPPSAVVRTLKLFGPYLWQHKIRVFLALACLIGAKVANVWVPLTLKRIVDSMSVPQPELYVPVFLLIAYGLFRLAATALAELRDAIFARVAQRAIRKVALKVFTHLHALSLRFHLSRQTGGVSRDIERGTRGMETIMRFMIFNILPTLVEILLVAGILLARFDGRFTLVIFLTLVIYIGYTLAVTEWRMAFRRTMNEMDTRANTRAIDSLLNFETVKYFGNEEFEARRYDDTLRQWEKAATRNSISLSGLNAGQAAIIAVGITILMIMAAYEVEAGAMTVGDLVMVNAFMLQLYMPLNFLGFVYRELKHASTDMDRMYRLLDVPEEVIDRPDAAVLHARHPTVRFCNVHFRYEPDREILKGVSFTIPAGHKVAVVGPSGSGKSTLARLLFRFYDVDEGAVTIDGQDLRTLTQKSVHAHIGVVPQDTVLFNDTIYYNILYGRPQASREEVEAAARAAHIHDFIQSLPKGYETEVGERGLKLSGGEKQRVAIARTILKNPPILIFDEATSALDSASEQAIGEELRRMAENRTTLIIAHRLSTVVDADEILVLEKGQVVEQGTHADLLRRNGRYAAMWALQQHDPDAA